MRVSQLIKSALVGGAVAALLLVGSAGTAQAAYPPSVDKLAASSTLSGGYATVTITGHNLTTGIHATATYKSKSVSSTFSINSAKTTGTTKLKISKILPKTAGQYTVTIKADKYASIKHTYTIGHKVTLKSVHATKTVHGFQVRGKAYDHGKVKITVTHEGKTKTYTDKANSAGWFSDWFRATDKGTYKIKVTLVATTKHFGAAPVTVTVKR